MSRIFYETIIDLIDTQISNSSNLQQVKTLGTILSDDKEANANKQKVIALLSNVIKKCKKKQDELGITNYLNDILSKLEKGE